jgi:hypothetical protein
LQNNQPRDSGGKITPKGRADRSRHWMIRSPVEV